MFNERSALVQEWLNNSEFGLTTAYPNKKFKPKKDTPHAELTFLGVAETPLEIGGTPTNINDAIFQILLKYPVEKGDQDAIKKSDEIKQKYKRGVRLSYGGDTVDILTVDFGAGFNSDGWFALPISVNWRAYVC